ncbi:PRC-barrel domain-containing protein [Kineosporia succinea]|uniref:Sporulation protein YlmC with PRC-barrel domain n=1 Tax=Kineosporia succinea TaxID=84632 RepID=A0ABT9P0Q3_9ACTN|nr:PRC-barrel domain-containing protein [Kineosporia succinea]MDP9826256.1 sporulation protein YlmC with PRC-barrel domain [Kineosporia succinea]
MIRFSDIAGNPVMDTSTATTIGRIEAPVVDPATRHVVGFRVKKSQGPGNVVLWSALAGLGPDALTVGSAEAVADPPAELKDRSGKKLDLLKRQVLTEHGHPLGKVRDVEFDPSDGRITSLLLKDSFVDGARLLGIGRYAVVVAG